MRPARLALVAAIGAGLLGVVVAASIDWAFWSRYLTRPQSPSDLAVEWYQPQVPVEGDYRPLPRSAEDDAARFSEAEEIAQTYNSRALIVALGDTIILEKYWGDTEPATPLLTFSFHKTVTALLLGIAIADGHIGAIDDPVGAYIPQWADDPRGQPTLRRVLQMSAGYAQPSREGGAFSPSARFSYGSDLVGATLAGGIEPEAQGRFDYGDRSGQIAGLALQNALPGNYETYLSERLWKPIGARDASAVKADRDGPVLSYCCLMATAEDWLRIGMLLRDEGRFGGNQVIPAEWIAEMAAPAASNPNFGLFLWRGTPFAPERAYTPASPARVRSERPFASDDVLFMDGAGGQRVYVSRKLDLVIVRIGEYRPDWDDTRLFNAIAKAIGKTGLVAG